MSLEQKRVILCLKRGPIASLYNFYSIRMEYVYTTDTNEIYLSYHNERIKIAKYEEINWFILTHAISYNDFSIIAKCLPTSCEEGELFNCLDSKEIYIGNGGKPCLVLNH